MSYWATVIVKDGIKTYDVHATTEKVHAVLSLWHKQPCELHILVVPCPCDSCRRQHGEPPLDAQQVASVVSPRVQGGLRR